MASETLKRLFEHNTWANLVIIEACSHLSDEHLDAKPLPTTKGSIRTTLRHLMAAEQRYVWRLTGLEPRFDWDAPPKFDELIEAARLTGQRLSALAEHELTEDLLRQIEGVDFVIKPWVIMVQVINHASEHREQIKSMLTALGIEPPEVYGWTYGEYTGAFVEATVDR